MKLTAFALALVFLPWMTVSASAQSMTVTPSQYTTTPSQYTTTPSQYTTTPAQYTTTPSQYTTTPQQYIPVQGTTTPTPPTTIPTRPPTTIPQYPGTGTTTPYSTTYSPTTMSLYSTTPTANQFQSAALESEMVDGVDMGEQRVEEEQTTSTGQAEGLVASYAQRVLGLDEAETQQFVIDFADVVTELGFETNEVSLRVGAKVVLYLSLKRVLGLPAFAAA